jgi:SAM-dependent methyltransferase
MLTPRTVSWLAKRHQLDPSGLRYILKFLALTTALIKDENGRFQLTEIPTPLANLRFNLEKFQEAYRLPLCECLHTLRAAPSKSRPPRINVDAMADAFSAVSHTVNHVVVKAVERSRVQCLLDLGCGTGSLLRTLAVRNHGFSGIGVDENRIMCRRMLSLACEAGVFRRISAVVGAVPAALRRFQRRERERVDGIYGSSFLNEFFGDGTPEPVEILKELGRLFPARTAWFVDYYGVLNTRKRNGPIVNVLQDIAQIVSGQGVPPSTDEAWGDLFRAGNCRVVSQRSFRNGSTKWGLHVVVLGTNTQLKRKVPFR